MLENKTRIIYHFLITILKPLYILLYHPTIVNKDKIPKSGSIVIAGNHTNILDPGCIILSSKRQIHFLAKEFLFNYPIVGPLFEKVGCIKVLKDRKNGGALREAIKQLQNGEIIGIFPEGRVKVDDCLLEPFKFGAVKMAKEANCKILPFAITGKFKLFKNDLKITYGNPLDISNMSLEDANNLLYNTVQSLIIQNT